MVVDGETTVVVGIDVVKDPFKPGKIGNAFPGCSCKAPLPGERIAAAAAAAFVPDATIESGGWV